MFHTQNGLFFERLADGEVRVIKTWDGREPRADNIACDEVLTPGSFASVTSSMSARGETSETHREALDFLQKP